MRQTAWVVLLGLTLPAFSHADGPADNIPENVRRIPKLGIDVSAQDREALEAGLEALSKSIATLEKSKDGRTRSLLPDVQIFEKAVNDWLKYQEFLRPAM